MPAGKKSEWQTFQSQLPPCVFQLVVNKLIRNSPSCSAALTIAGIFRQEKVFIPSWYRADSKRQLFFLFPSQRDEETERALQEHKLNRPGAGYAF